MASEEDVVIRVRYDVDDSELQRSIRDASGGQGATGGGAAGANARGAGGGGDAGGGGRGGGGGIIAPPIGGKGGFGPLLKAIGPLVAALGVAAAASDVLGQEMKDAADVLKAANRETAFGARATVAAAKATGARGLATDIQAIEEAAGATPAGFGLLSEEDQLNFLAAQASVSAVGIKGRKDAEDIRRFQTMTVIQRMSNVEPSKGGTIGR